MKSKYIISISILLTLLTAPFANGSTISLNVFGAYLEGSAYFKDGCCGTAGIHLPDYGLPSFSLSVTLPDEKNSWQDVIVEVDWAVDADARCNMGLRPNYVSTVRPGYVGQVAAFYMEPYYHEISHGDYVYSYNPSEMFGIGGCSDIDSWDMPYAILCFLIQQS